MSLYDDYRYDCESVACEFAHEITFYWVLYGLLIAALFKLLRFDNIAKQIFSAALIGPIFALVVSIPLLVVFAFLAYFNLEDGHRWLVATLIVVLMAVIFFIAKYEAWRNSFSSEAARSFYPPWWDLKFHFIVYFDTYYPWSWSNKQEKINKYQPSYETQIVEIAKTIGTEH